MNFMRVRTIMEVTMSLADIARCRPGSMMVVYFLSVFASGSSHADVRLPSVIGSNMVLQRDMAAPIWGWADPGEQVTVVMGSTTLQAKADANGAWMMKLPQMSAGGPFELVIRGKNTIRLTNVMVGEVWVCSGQSNMEMRLCHVKDAALEVANSLHHDIRLFQVTNDVYSDPQKTCDARWEECRPSTVYIFSAAAYFFGREIEKELNVPIGLIHSSWGGTPAETWIRVDALKKSPELKSILDTWDPILKSNPPELLDYYRKAGQQEEDVHFVEFAGKSGLPQYASPPKLAVRITAAPSVPAWAYNGMIAPLVPFAIRGVLWNQGESNVARAFQYRTLFPALIQDWRAAWGEGDFPFLFVQIANYGRSAQEPGESTRAELREAQLMTLSLPKTGMAVTIDIGDSANIHPLNKQEVGMRLALAALATTYGKNIEYSGPIYRTMTVREGKACLRFDHAGGGLATSDGVSPKGFSIAGKDGVFRWASASIEGDEVVVMNPAVQEPVMVRYGWADNPTCTLTNREGLPASPFRTDTLPGTTVGK
jgi:sialate O-acetylesterase